MRRKRWIFGCIGLIILIIACNQSKNKTEIIPANKQNEKKQAKVYFDTIFPDGVKFYCDYSQNIISFFWWKNDSTYLEAWLDSFNLKKSDYIPEMDFDIQKFKNVKLERVGKLYRENGLILFGYYYLPHNICLYYIDENSLQFGKAYFGGKWIYPKLVSENHSLLIMNEDFENEKDPADDLLFFKMDKIRLENFQVGERKSFYFTNKDINYECLDDNDNIDSCLWMNLLKSNNKLAKFIFSE